MTRWTTSRRFAVFFSLTLAGIAPAQDPGLRDQPLPRDLFEGLVAAYGRPQSTIVVGELPPALQGRLFVPPGAKIVGGSYTSAQSYAVITLAARPESIAAMYQREMTKTGWAYLPATNYVAAPSGGFQNMGSPTPGPSVNAPNVFCNNGAAIVLRIDYQGLGMTRLLFSTFPTYPQCQMGRTVGGTTVTGPGGTIISQSMSMSTVFRPHQLPMLVNPASAPSQMGVCPIDNASMGGPGTELATTMSVDQLFDHYGKQLADSGWKPLGALTMSRTWTRTDSAGNRSDATLTIRTFPEVPNCRKITTDLKGRRR